MEHKHTNSSNLAARKRMVDALMDLLKEKPLSSITVTDITKRSGVSRMTYYRNYETMDDIFISYLHDIILDYHKDFEKFPEKGNYYDYRNILHCLNYFDEYADFVNSLFVSGLGYVLLNRMSQYLVDYWYNGNDLDEYYRLNAFAGSAYNMLIVWMMRGKKEPAEQIACALHEIYMR